MNFTKSMSGTEKEIMEYIWSLDEPISSSELLNYFNNKGKDWKIQTLSTFLKRLVEKGILKSEQKGRSHYYTHKITFEQYESLQAKNFLNNMYNGSIKNFLSALYNEKIEKDDIDELKDWINKM